MMGHPLFWLAYLLGALVAGVAGRRRTFGFFGFFLLSLLITPPVVFLVLILTQTRSVARGAPQ
jgi:hypothetical protein